MLKSVLKPGFPKAVQRRRPSTRGIMYVATGDEQYFIDCISSILTLKNFTTERICVLSNEEKIQKLQKLDVEVKIVKNETSNPSRWLKTQLYEHSPFDTTLFLDTDIRCLAPFDELWNICSSYSSFVVARDQNEFLNAATFKIRDEEIEEVKYTISTCNKIVHYNSGVMLFNRSENCKKLFQEWHKEWLIFNGKDQFALVRAINNNIHIYELNKYIYNWNKINPYLKFLHGWSHRPPKQSIHFGTLEYKSAIDFLN
jgi:lipopolysaccharide biosynthesis glycosyltransferase